MISPRALLMDLDGTLADTAADLAGALNRLLAEEGLPQVKTSDIRSVASDGSRALLRVGFGLRPEDPDYGEYQERLLAHYRERIADETRLFAGMSELLAAIHRYDLPWGVVTNKPSWLTEPLMKKLKPTPRPGCVISGDTVRRAKPYPDPLFLAAARLDVPTGHCLYVGDAARDVEAARSAGMPVVVAGWGYLPRTSPPDEWNADQIFDSPGALQTWLIEQLDRDADNAR